MQPRKNDTAWSQERKHAETGPERGKVSVACDSGVRGRGGGFGPKVTVDAKRTGSLNEKYRTKVQKEEEEDLKRQRRLLFSS